MNASPRPPTLDSESAVTSFISAASIGVIGAPTSEQAAATFANCVSHVGGALRESDLPLRQFAVDRLQNIAVAAQLTESHGDDWIQGQLARAFDEADEPPNSVFAEAAAEYRRERGNGAWPPAPARREREENLVPLADVIAGEPPDRGVPPPGEPVGPSRPKFVIEPFDAIKFEASEEWLVKRLVPRQGVVTVYGASQSFKSFVVLDVALHVALGWQWAGRLVTQAPAVYIAAEGAAGLRKRKVGFERANAAHLPEHVPFFLISAAPNLGTEQGDLAALIAAIETLHIGPGLIVIDTLAQSIGAGDENGAGMIQFVANATALANHFKACVLPVHHVGLSDDKRARGHSSLLGGVDAQLLAERKEGMLSTVLTLQKLKDEESNLRLTAHLGRVVIGQDEDGDEVSTLIIDRIEDGAATHTATTPKTIPRAQRLLMDMVKAAIDDAGEDFLPFANGPAVRAVSDDAVRSRYYARIAEQAESGEDAHKMAERQRKAFNRAIASAVKAKDLIAKQRNGERLLWLP